VNFRGATVDNFDLNADYGGQTGRLGYYFFVDGFTSGRYLDPPEPKELFDFGKGSRATTQLDWRAGKNDTIRLLLMGSGANFQQPNITDDQAVGRDAQRHLRQYTAILGWTHTFSPDTLLHTSLYTRSSSDHVLPTTDPITPLSDASRSGFALASRVTSRTPGAVTSSRQESISSNSARARVFSSSRAAIPIPSLPFKAG